MNSFAAGVKPGENKQPAKYELFRSYRIGAEATESPLAGPNPGNCQIPEVFAAPTAAKFFLRPYTIEETTFFDGTFPQSHPISSIALNEAINLYGRNIEISVLLNIGPGRPADKDCQELDLMTLGTIGRLVRRFIWPLGRRPSLKQKLSITSTSREEPAGPNHEIGSPSVKALVLETSRRKDIRTRLEKLYGPSAVDKYHHLGPDYSVERASLNDVHALRLPQIDSVHLKKQCKDEAESMVRVACLGAVAA